MDPFSLGLQALMGSLGSGGGAEMLSQFAGSPTNTGFSGLTPDVLSGGPMSGMDTAKMLSGSGMSVDPFANAITATVNPMQTGTPGVSAAGGSTTLVDALTGAVGGSPTTTPAAGAQAAQGVQTPKAPETPFSGGVSGAQRAPEAKLMQGSNMQVLIDSLMQNAGKGANVASLGALLGSPR